MHQAVVVENPEALVNDAEKVAETLCDDQKDEEEKKRALKEIEGEVGKH